MSKLKIGLIVAALVVVSIFALETTNTTHIFHKSPAVRAPSKPITQLPQSNNANNAKNVGTSNTNVTTGSESDKNGAAPANTPTDARQWSTSASGQVVVKLPTANGHFSSGSTITGTAKSSSVQYRLVDNQAGVISQGSINVVGGNFTAEVTFKSYSSAGRLDVFNTDDSGREINEVQVPVNF